MRTRKTILALLVLSLSLTACFAVSTTTTSRVVEVAPVETESVGAPVTRPTSTPAATLPPPTAFPTFTPVVPVTLRPAVTTTKPPPTPTATPTFRPFPVTGTPVIPMIFAFGVAPSVVDAGYDVLLSWDAHGQRAFICPLLTSGEWLAACRDVPLVGTQMITLNTGDRACEYLGFTLHVIEGDFEVTQFIAITVRC